MNATTEICCDIEEFVDTDCCDELRDPCETYVPLEGDVRVCKNGMGCAEWA